MSYIKEKSTYEISDFSENIIIGKGTIAYSSVDSELMLSCKYTIIKENGNWVLDKYEEEL